MDKNIAVLILAGGQGTRMKSKIPKMQQNLCGQFLLQWTIKAASIADEQPLVLIGAEQKGLERLLLQCDYRVHQDMEPTPLEAVRAARARFSGRGDYILVLPGDMPLMSHEQLEDLVEFTQNNECACGILSLQVEADAPYARIQRHSDGMISGIVPAANLDPITRHLYEADCGVYCFESGAFLRAIDSLAWQGTSTGDIALIADQIARERRRVGSLAVSNPEFVFDVNDGVQLSAAREILRQRILVFHLHNGVQLLDPPSTFIDAGVSIGMDTVIYPNNQLEGSTAVGEDCILYPNNRLVNAKLGHGVQVQASVILDSQIGDQATVGPYAYLRPDTKVGPRARIGDFVELKNARIGEMSRISHLSYVGDADIGEDCNIGCGVVFSNYDGQKKSHTQVGDRAFIGCNVNLVAPVRIGAGAYVAAGSTVTVDVPDNALCIARSRETIKENWAVGRIAPHK